MDTVGEFAGIARDPGFRLPGEPILPGVRLIGRRREFANSISNGTENRCKPRSYPVSDRVNRKCHAMRATPTPCFSQSARADIGRTLFVSGGEGVESHFWGQA
jgi:hypothetical protein